MNGCAYFNAFYLVNKTFQDAEYDRRKNNGAAKAGSYSMPIKWGEEFLEKHYNSRYVGNTIYIMGMSYFYHKDYVLARNRFDELLNTFPESKYTLDARFYKARCLVGLNQNDEARIILNELMQSGDRSMKGRAGLALAEITYANEQWSELLSTAQNVIESDPEKEQLIEAVVYKGEALFRLERYEECITEMEKIVELKLVPEWRFKTNTLIAQSKAKLGNFEEASSHLESLQNRGEFASYETRIRLEMGRIYELHGDDELAMETYRNMAGDYPDSVQAKEAWYLVGTILIKDLSNSKIAKEAFDMVEKGKATTTETWLVEAKIKSAQIDSIEVRLKRIENLEDDPEACARARYSLAELYTYSFDRPDSALTQYRLIMEEAPDTEYAVMSDFFIRQYELEESGKYSEEAEKEIMEEIIEKYSDTEFAHKLKVFLGVTENPLDVVALEEAENAKFSDEDPEVYLPLYQKVVDNFPGTRSAYQALYVLAYSYEHDLEDIDKAIELYTGLADETPKFISKEFIDKAIEKLDYYAQEPKMIEEIQSYLAGYESRKESDATFSEASEQTAGSITVMEEEVPGDKKIRFRNARIRSRYFTD